MKAMKEQNNKKKSSQPPVRLSTTRLAVLGICGLSGAGKTTLIEAILPELVRRGLRVAVVKHDCRNLMVDLPGKDSDRLYRAGADVFLLGGEEFVRLHGDDGSSFEFQLSQLARQYDLVLVEGHGQTPVPKLWLLADDGVGPPADTDGEGNAVLKVFPRGEATAVQVLDFLLHWLHEIWLQTPVWACVLIGGRSSRMGRPKHLLEKEASSTATTWLEHTVALLQPLIGDHIALSGAGFVPECLAHLPRLPDIQEARGPLTGILAAMRWQPAVSWLLIACDMPDISTEALTWLLGHRQPGCWGTVPCLHEDGYVEPLLAHYDYRCAPLFEQLLASGSLRIGQIARQSKIKTPLIPLPLRSSWHNINTPQELARSREARAEVGHR
ncbi:MAG: molybdopterin-guanine dinucleotide biosynthesis protein B [Desulfocapsaceae bacterium]|nr:molybdopterin-guanine dinucleotide biosynthesis protein B [Desulfocapsaceae bacterium]